MDLFKLFFSKKCILFEGISEELLIRSYIDSKETLSDIEVLSFHKGLKKIMNIWKKVNEGSGNKLGIVVIMIINLTLRSNMINIMMIRKYVLEQPSIIL